MLKLLLWIFAIPATYGILSLLGMLCFEISIRLDKRNIEGRREIFNKAFLMVGWLVPFIFVIDLCKGKYKKTNKGD